MIGDPIISAVRSFLAVMRRHGRVALFAVLLAVAGSLISVGAFDVSRAAGFVTSGVLLAVWSWLVLAG